MIELYFLIFRIPKMMTQLARERNRSALALESDRNWRLDRS